MTGVHPHVEVKSSQLRQDRATSRVTLRLEVESPLPGQSQRSEDRPQAYEIFGLRYQNGEQVCPAGRFVNEDMRCHWATVWEQCDSGSDGGCCLYTVGDGGEAVTDRLLVDVTGDGNVSVSPWLSDQMPEPSGPPGTLVWPLDDEALADLRWYLEDYLRAPYGVYQERGARVGGALPGWGEAYSGRCLALPGRRGTLTGGCVTGPGRWRS